MIATHKIRVGVLRGGPSSEYPVSLETGKNVLAHLPEEFYTPVDILVSKEGVWHEAGVERRPDQILKRLDVAFNAMHGKYGEDGELSKILENFNVPYTGSKPFSSALSMNKILSKKIYRDSGLKTPFSMQINFDDLSRDSILEIYYGMPGPYVVKPASSGSSIGVHIVHTRPELEEAIVSAFEYSPQVLVEEFIRGKEATAGVVDGFRGEKHYVLPPIEIRHGARGFFDNEVKYNGEAEEICPGNFSKQEKEILSNMSRIAHASLGLRHYSRSDFRIHPTRGIFILETNSLPGLTKESLVPKALSAIGAKFSDFLHHLITLAVDPSGFEPLTSSLQMRRSTN